MFVICILMIMIGLRLPKERQRHDCQHDNAENGQWRITYIDVQRQLPAEQLVDEKQAQSEKDESLKKAIDSEATWLFPRRNN